jgi:lipopolysaccharide transport system ATP-binding protein
MKDVSTNEGRTVLFVSHNMLAVKSLCTTGLLLDKGKIETAGAIEDVIFKYTSIVSQNIASFIQIEKENQDFTVHSISISNNGINGSFNIEEDLEFEIKTSGTKEYESININIFFKSSDDSIVFATCSNPERFNIGEYIFNCVIPANTLNDIIYTIDIMVVEKGPKILHHLQNIISIEGTEIKREGAWMGKFPGLLRPMNYKWTKQKVNDNV